MSELYDNKKMNKNIFIEIVRPYTMTSVERIIALFDSLEYIRKNKISGDIVECGVWKGGNILGIIEYLNYYEIYDKNVWLYDTFNGMTQPEEIDMDYFNRKAIDIFQSILCVSLIDEVKKNLSISKYPNEKIKYIIGDVEKTLNNEINLPNQISLLRLDTDFYKSTKKELNVLFPILSKNGVLIVDDYGYWQGSKKAVDEYFNEFTLIEHIDDTGIKIIKE